MSSSIAKNAVRERFGAEKITRNDMLGSFIQQGLNKADTESESLVQMYAKFSRFFIPH
jgi:hypothetical protein